MSERAVGAMRAAGAMRTLVIGESLVKAVMFSDETDRRYGEGPVNLACALATRGVDTTLLTQVGADNWSDAIVARLEEASVTLMAAARSGDTLVWNLHMDSMGTTAARSAVGWPWTLSGAPLPPVDAADIVHYGSLGAALTPGAHHVDDYVAAARAHALISYAPRLNATLAVDATPADARARVDRQAAASDIVTVGLSELMLINDSPNGGHWWDATDDERQALIEQSATVWLTRGTALVAVFDWRRGLTLVTARGVVTLPRTELYAESTPSPVNELDDITARLLVAIDSAGIRGRGSADALRNLDARELSLT